MAEIDYDSFADEVEQKQESIFTEFAQGLVTVEEAKSHIALIAQWDGRTFEEKLIEIFLAQRRRSR